MSQIAQQIIPTTFSDPNNVREVYVNGPINFNIMGPCATLTFTVARGELDQLMKGQQLSKLSATVVSRVTMPVQLAAELRNLLNKLIQDQPIAPGSNLTQ